MTKDIFHFSLVWAHISMYMSSVWFVITVRSNMQFNRSDNVSTGDPASMNDWKQDTPCQMMCKSCDHALCKANFLDLKLQNLVEQIECQS